MSHEHLWFLPHMCCPGCHGSISAGGIPTCLSCGFTGSGVMDFRVLRNDTKTLALPVRLQEDPEEILKRIRIGRPSIDYAGPSARRDPRELFSVLRGRLEKGAALLDVGCGPRDQHGPAEFMGYRYVGIDYRNSAADLLADAHALPFRDESFDGVLSYAVLEHLHNPFIAIREVERVLKPGGVFVGTVSQGEPFHNSFFHFTAWGLLALLGITSTLYVERIWGSMDTLRSLANMGSYPKALRPLIRILDLAHLLLPILSPRKMRWPEREKQIDRLHRSGSLCFEIVKRPS